MVRYPELFLQILLESAFDISENDARLHQHFLLDVICLEEMLLEVVLLNKLTMNGLWIAPSELPRVWARPNGGARLLRS